MSRLLVHVEGQTEEDFVNAVLAPHLSSFGYDSVAARLLGNSRQRDRRGGIRAWSAVRKDIVRHLQEDRGCLSTTMVDFYALPMSGDRAWPGRARAAGLPSGSKAHAVECALLADIVDLHGAHGYGERFIPYVMTYEFEGLLFSDCTAFGNGIGKPELSPKFQAIRARFETPEDINDSPETAPSKRILALLPGYQKPLMGALAALEIGLDAICRECPLFSRWLNRIEQWPARAIAPS